MDLTRRKTYIFAAGAFAVATILFFDGDAEWLGSACLLGAMVNSYLWGRATQVHKDAHTTSSS